MTLQSTLAILWALPYTLLGIAIGIIGLCTQGHVQLRSRTIEFYGGGVAWMFERLLGGQFMAMTLGHTLLGRTAAALDISRAHEMVHVRQYERWGPFFGPAYLLTSLYIWIVGGRAYRDNPFEVEAYDNDRRDPKNIR